VVEVLGHLGVEIRFPDGQTCCGQPAYNAGFWEEARDMARHTIEVLEAKEGLVVIPSGSCAAMVRHGYPELFSADPVWLPRALALANRTFEFSQFLVDALQVTDVEAVFTGRLAYHPSCHLLRGLGVDRQPLALLGAVRGASIVRLEPECCGFGGVFAIDEADISAAMLARRLGLIQASGARAVVGCDVSCLMQIEGGLRRRGSPVRCAHLAQVLSGQEPGLR
jgi:L-lactate dehydrogenase complex protein LldE